MASFACVGMPRQHSVNGMTATDQQILDAAKDAMLDILNGRTEEFQDGNEKARTLRIAELKSVIQEYESKVNAVSGNVFRPIREVVL